MNKFFLYFIALLLFSNSAISNPKINAKTAILMDFNSDEIIYEMDADFSHRIEDLNKMLVFSNNYDLVIGSRYIEGGSSEGWSKRRKSLSRFANKSAKFITGCKIEDMTSGFIIGKKEYFAYKSFQNAFYGDYFVYLVNDLISKNIEIIEIGYECGLRKYGVSKTGSSLFQLIKLARPYLKAALQSKWGIFENFW